MPHTQEFSNSTDSMFRTSFGQNIFQQKYQHEGCETWPKMADTVVEDVTGEHLPDDERDYLKSLIRGFKFVPAGRYLYYAGRSLSFFNNCLLLRATEDTREEWGHLAKRATDSLMSGAGIGVDYSVLRENGAQLSRTGGVASGPISLMEMINEIGRRVMQGGSRRSAIYASLNWQHPDVYDSERKAGETFLRAKDWHDMPIAGAGMTVADAKREDFNYAAPLDMTNISPNYDNEFLRQIYGLGAGELEEARPHFENMEVAYLPDTFVANARQALKTGEPGFSFNFFENEDETLRNACCELVSADDSDVCNLGSLNMAQFTDIGEWREAVRSATKFLLAGTLEADLPYDKVYEVRKKNRRLGLGLMGVHEWLMQRGEKYEVTPELHDWLEAYEEESDRAAEETASEWGVSVPVGKRAIAPTGSIGILAGTTTGIEPLFAVAFKRRYLKGGEDWYYQYVVDGTAKSMINDYGLDPDEIETALDLASDPERRIKFQYDVGKYVDHAISSTINLPAWGTEGFSATEEGVENFAHTVAKYAHGLRGLTVYPDGARGGQPMSTVPYEEAIQHEGEEFQEEAVDICDLTKGGTCGE